MTPKCKPALCEVCLVRPPQAEYTMCRPCWRSNIRPGESFSAWQQRRRAIALAKPAKPTPLPRAVRELLRDVVLWRRAHSRRTVGAHRGQGAEGGAMSASTTWNARINRHAGATLRLAAMVVGNVCGLPDDDECDPEKQRVMALAAKDEHDALVASLEARDSRAAELEAALRNLVETMPDPDSPASLSTYREQLRAALLLLAKGG